jgi:D-alanyl-D-alanine dipeptidase
VNHRTAADGKRRREKMVIIPWALLGVLVATLVGLCSAVSPLSMDIPTGFVNAADVVPQLVVEMRYSTMHNFVGSPVMGYDGPHVCIPSPSYLRTISVFVQKRKLSQLSQTWQSLYFSLY